MEKTLYQTIKRSAKRLAVAGLVALASGCQSQGKDSFSEYQSYSQPSGGGSSPNAKVGSYVDNSGADSIRKASSNYAHGLMGWDKDEWQAKVRNDSLRYEGLEGSMVRGRIIQDSLNKPLVEYDKVKVDSIAKAKEISDSIYFTQIQKEIAKEEAEEKAREDSLYSFYGFGPQRFPIDARDIEKTIAVDFDKDGDQDVMVFAKDGRSYILQNKFPRRGAGKVGGKK